MMKIIYLLPLILFTSKFCFSLDMNNYIQNSIKKYNLINLPIECIDIKINHEDKNFYYVDVRENHNSSMCEGDPEISINLFSLKIEKQTLDVYTDQENWSDGSSNYRKLNADDNLCDKYDYSNYFAKNANNSLNYKVNQKRVYLHTAPFSECIQDNQFLVHNDEVTEYLQSRGYSYIKYHKKDGTDIFGWIPILK